MIWSQSVLKFAPVVFGIAGIGAGYAEMRSSLSEVESVARGHEAEITDNTNVITRVDERTIAIQKQLDRIERLLEKQ